MRYLSVCSGIEAATAAGHPLGWTPVAFSEIDPFASAVLAHHYPQTPNWGDMTNYRSWPYDDIDTLVGGTPCQSFSVAGLRKALDDPRGNLALVYLGIAAFFRPQWIVWENVRGVLSSNRGRDFGAFLGALGQLGYGWAYRVLDAQYYGVAQRRRRVFVVGCLGNWRRAAAVLFDGASMRGDPAPRREAREAVAPTIAGGAEVGCADVVGSLCADTHPGAYSGQDAYTGRLIAFNARQDPDAWLERTGPLDCDGSTQAVARGMQVRRLTPRECERLQGFPDDYTLIPYRGKPAADGPRYKALGNSMAVPVMRWIGRRIQMVEDLGVPAVCSPASPDTHGRGSTKCQY
jgi:DNA (cytosine-5)-methyltransferase 1